MKRIITITLTALALCSCIFEDISDCPNYVEGAGEPIEVEFLVSSADSSQTRSSVQVTEDAVKYLTVCIYHNGKLVKNAFYESPSSFSISLVKGLKYNMYAIANYGRLPDLQTEEQMTGFKFTTGNITKITSGFPMSWSLTDYLAGKDSEKVTVSLERLVSKINLTIDSSGLEDFTVTDVRLCQTAWMVYPFKEESKAEEAGDVAEGDYASSSDLTDLNSGKSISFYALENCQGVLLPNNKSADSKIPSEISDASDLCTYLEMTASFSGEYQGVDVSSDNVKYRFYIGKDNCTDFNVVRNHDVNINLTVTEDRIFDESWKVSYGDDLPSIGYAFTLSQSSVGLNVGGSTAITATYHKTADGSIVSSSDVTSYAAWTSSNTSVATVSDGKITAVAAGTATITATYNGYRETVTVTVSNVLGYGLVLSMSTLSVQAGSTASLEAYYVKYTNGVETSRTNVTSSATWKSSLTSILTVSGGTVTGVSAGQAVVTASYGGYNQTCTVTVTKKPVEYTYGLELSPTSTSVYVGETAKVTAYYITYADGVKSSSTAVNSSASWSTSDSSIATVSGGTVSGVAAGSATITATYYGYSATATVNVEDKVTYDYYLSPTSTTTVTGRTTKLTAVQRTFTNGVQTNGQDMSSSFSWTSSDTSVATVASNGVITGVSPGTATITGTYAGTTLTGTVTVTPLYTYELSISPTTLSITKGAAGMLSSIYKTYADGVLESSKDVSHDATWTSSDTDIAVVSVGAVTAKEGGSVTITATYNGISATASVTVNATPELKLGWSSQTLERGDVITNAAIYYPNNGNSPTVVTTSTTWTTSNAGVATVAGGTISAQGAGTAIITATYNGYSASCTVTVAEDTSNPVNTYVSNMSLTSEWLSGTTYKLMLTLTFSDGTKIEDVPYTWSISYAQSPDIDSSTTGEGPIVYTGSGSTYVMAVVVTTTSQYYDSSGNYRTHSTGTSFSHNVSWTP